MRELLTVDQLSCALSQLDGWALGEGNGKIEKSFKFESFITAMAFMNKVAIVAEEMNHHPNWSNSYNRVDVALTTHSAGGLTKLDIDMANAMDNLT